jgi:hypothetical protein
MSSTPNTSDVWDIAQFVEGHPDNHEQRWRLAKKLYMSGEYRLALEHLQILNNEWPDQINVWRYLAATYYRLSRYDEAVRELKQAIARWPQALGIREQYAKALERAGQRTESADAWGVVAKMNPDHPFAARAERKLRKREQGAEEQKQAQKFAAIGGNFDSGLQVICPNCRSKNGPDYDRCWNCLAPLHQDAITNRSTPRIEQQASSAGPILTGVLIVGLLSYCVYATLNQLTSIAAMDTVYASAKDAILAGTIYTRITIGAILLIAWPVALRVAMMIVDSGDVSPNRLHAAGIGLAALTYATVHWPSDFFLIQLAVPAIASLGLIVILFGLGRIDALIVWSVQALVVTLVSITAAVAFHGPGTVLEFPAISRAAATIDAPRAEEIAGITPLESTLVLRSTGSNWLDARIAQAEFVVNASSLEHRVFAEVLEAGRTVEFIRVDAPDITFNVDELEAGLPYTVRVTSEGRDAISADITIRSLLQPELGR